MGQIEHLLSFLSRDQRILVQSYAGFWVTA
jgi:hypothetical protein